MIYSPQILIIISLSLACGILIGILLGRYLFLKSHFHKKENQPILKLNEEKERWKIPQSELEDLTLAFNKMLDSLRRSEVYVEGIIQDMADTVIITDREGKITRVNQAVESLLGYTEAELKDKPVSSLFVNGNTLSIKKGMIKTDLNLSYLTKTGQVIPASLKCSELKLAGEESIGAVIIGRDLREMGKLIDDLAKANEELKKSNELKSEFVSTVSHELRTPLTSIQGFTDLLLNGVVGELNEKQNRYLTKISTNSGRLARLIDNLLSVSKIESGQFKMLMKIFLVEPLIEEVIAFLAPQWKKKQISVIPSYPEKLPTIYSSYECLEQIMINLLSNAIKFTPQGGRITISGVEETTHLIIKVTDTGVGIPPKDIEKVFEKFYRASSSAEGTGLGLAITKGLVERLGGEIWIESKVGKGTTVGFTLPKRQ
ncbi:MAG: PAS domain-containing sensor histidine kinase [bacterium]